MRGVAVAAAGLRTAQEVCLAMPQKHAESCSIAWECLWRGRRRWDGVGLWLALGLSQDGLWAYGTCMLMLS